jgi:hypothetical protein
VHKKDKILAIATAVENFLHRRGWALLLVFALVYYAQYYRAGLNLGGEGGTNAVLALRLMEGQRPIIDTFLGYNLLWFYPIVALFKITGPDYTALRIFFFVICTINALLGFAVVRAATGRGWLAFATGILLVLVPGMIFRNYMGLVGVLSMLVLLKAYVLPAVSEHSRFRWMLAAGAAMSLCFLLRIEPSLLLAIVWIGLAVLYPVGSRIEFLPRVLTSLRGTLAALLVFAAIHGSVYWHAHERGFGREFIGQYTAMIGYFGYELSQQWTGPRGADAEAVADQPIPTIVTNGHQAADGATRQPSGDRSDWVQDRLRRPPLANVWKAERPSERYFGVCLYYPVLWASVFVAVALGMLGAAILRGDSDNKQSALTILTTTGCALSLFPQYFFFRPDAPHLSEFMVPFLPAIACSVCATWDAARRASTASWRTLVWLLVVPSVLVVPLYLKAIMPRESAGTWFRQGETVEFSAANGVHVKLPASDAREMKGLRDIILAHSGPGDWVICYPYAPTINFMTDRRSYEHNLYVDDATAGTDFIQGAIERAAKMQPAVFVIDDRPINGTEASRFSNWARPFMDYLETGYKLAGTFRSGRREIHVYVNPDKAR